MWNHVGLYIFAANNRYMKQMILIFVATLFLLHANAATPDDSLAIRMAYDNLCQGDTESAMAILAEASGRQHIQPPHRNSDNTFLLLGMTGMTAIAALSFFAWEKRQSRYRQQLLHEQAETRENLSNTFQTRPSFLNLALAALNQTAELSLLAERKLSAGQAKDLFATLAGGKYLKKDIETFFAEYDRSFQEFYPEFFDRLNLLLKPDMALPLPAGGRLTPEMRIASLMSLGIIDSSTLSKTMGLSLNTVYTYRNRLKSRATDRDSFDDSLRALASQS